MQARSGRTASMVGTTHLKTDIEEPFGEVEWWIQQKNLVEEVTKVV
jgi:hypothetical protein